MKRIFLLVCLFCFVFVKGQPPKGKPYAGILVSPSIAFRDLTGVEYKLNAGYAFRKVCFAGGYTYCPKFLYSYLDPSLLKPAGGINLNILASVATLTKNASIIIELSGERLVNNDCEAYMDNIMRGYNGRTPPFNFTTSRTVVLGTWVSYGLLFRVSPHVLITASNGIGTGTRNFYFRFPGSNEEDTWNERMWVGISGKCGLIYKF